MTPLQKTQVVIVGAGPTGLSLAAQLLRYNIDFIILEKNEKTTHLSKAVVVQARTLEIFQEMGLAEKAIKTGRLTMAFNMFHKGKRRIHLNLTGLGEGKSAFPFVLSLEQSKTEKLLAGYLEAHGKSIRWQAGFVDFKQDQNGVIVHYNDADGIVQEIGAAYIVGCDGAASPIRHAAGMTFKGDTIPKIFYVADVTLTSSVINKDELFIFLIDKGFILFFPMEGTGHYRIIGILPEITEEESNTLAFSDIEDSIRQKVSVPLAFEEINWFSHYKVHSRKAETFRNKRCFIAGDAAHIHTPAGGQGMNTGIQDAYNLAWKLAYAIDGKAGESLLETYNTERMENAGHLLRTTDRMFDFMAGTGWFSNFVRLQIFPLMAGFLLKNEAINKRVFPLLSQTGIGYKNSPLTVESEIGKVKSGDRMHYFEFGDGKNIFDYLAGPTFKIIYFGSNPRLDGFKINSMHFTEIPKSLFGNATDFYILLRPDNHISYIGKDSEAITALLAQFNLQPNIKS